MGGWRLVQAAEAESLRRATCHRQEKDEAGHNVAGNQKGLQELEQEADAALTPRSEITIACNLQTDLEHQTRLQVLNPRLANAHCGKGKQLRHWPVLTR